MSLPITRREAVVRMALLMGASVVGPKLLANTPAEKATLEVGRSVEELFTADDIALLDEIGETIIPTTDIPGAKATNIGAFIAMMVADCYIKRDQDAFKAGLAKLAADYEQRYGEKFISGKPENRTQFLNELDREQREYSNKHRRELSAGNRVDGTVATVPHHYFRIMRELTILGYFSSEIGCTQAVEYLEVPGRYDGNVPYKKGDKLYI